MSGRTMTTKSGFTFRLIGSESGYACRHYYCEKDPNTEWPEQQEVLECLDNGFGAPFGGRYEQLLGEHNRKYTVHTD